MQRDDDKCVISGARDPRLYNANLAKYSNTSLFEPLVLAHILPFSLNDAKTDAQVSPARFFFVLPTILLDHGQGRNLDDNNDVLRDRNERSAGR
jgi:hypothetical protein